MAQVPTLSPEGWIKDPAEMLNRLFMHADAAAESQSPLYYGSITSIPGIISRNPNNINETASALSEALTRYFGRYFTKAEVNVRDDTPDDSARREVILDVRVSDGTKQYSLGVTLQRSSSESTNYYVKILKGEQ